MIGSLDVDVLVSTHCSNAHFGGKSNTVEMDVAAAH